MGEISSRYSWTTGMKRSLEILSSKKGWISGLSQIDIFTDWWIWGVANFKINYFCLLSLNIENFCAHINDYFLYFPKHTRCLKKNGILWKNVHNFLQTHPKWKIWGCFGKFRIFSTRWALRFSKLKKNWLRKWSLKFPTPPPKIGRIHCSHYALIWWSSAFSWLAMKSNLVPHIGRM